MKTLCNCLLRIFLEDRGDGHIDLEFILRAINYIGSVNEVEYFASND